MTDKRIPEIPQFVADWIDYHTDSDSLSDTIHFVIYYLHTYLPDSNISKEMREPVLCWLDEDRERYFKLVDAVRNGYRVNQMNRYYIQKDGEFVSRVVIEPFDRPMLRVETSSELIESAYVETLEEAEALEVITGGKVWCLK